MLCTMYYFSSNLKLKIYLTLVRSHFAYCCQLWRPHLFKDISAIEKVQRRATKFILGNSLIPYKDRLTTLGLLPLSLWLELQDVLFMVKCLQTQTSGFNILEYVSFSTNATRAAANNKLAYKLNRTSVSHHFYFNRIVRLWNSLPNIDLSRPFTAIKSQLTQYFTAHFTNKFDQYSLCSYNVCCPCSNCHLSQSIPYSTPFLLFYILNYLYLTDT